MVAQMVKHLPAKQETPGFDPWVRKIRWRREWLPTPVILPGKSHGQRSLAGYIPWGQEEFDMPEQLSNDKGTRDSTPSLKVSRAIVRDKTKEHPPVLCSSP